MYIEIQNFHVAWYNDDDTLATINFGQPAFLVYVIFNRHRKVLNIYVSSVALLLLNDLEHYSMGSCKKDVTPVL